MENTPDMDESPSTALMDVPPEAAKPTNYDWVHRVCYLRMLDADAVGTDWRDVARTVMKLDPNGDPGRVHEIWKTHLRRAQWMTTHGYREYLISPGSAEGSA